MPPPLALQLEQASQICPLLISGVPNPPPESDCQYQRNQTLSLSCTGTRGIAFLLFLFIGVALHAIDAAETVAPALPLVTQQGSQALIIVSEKASKTELLASEVLKDHIQKISGVEVPVLREDALTHPQVTDGFLTIEGGVPDGIITFILVGDPSLAHQFDIDTEKLGPGGILLKTTKNTILLWETESLDPNALGSDTNLHPVTKFLEDQFGVRYLWPGRDLWKEDSKLIQIRIGERV